MANERQREIGREIKERYPKRDFAQQEFRMIYNAYRQAGTPEVEAEERAIATLRKAYPGFTPVRASV